MDNLHLLPIRSKLQAMETLWMSMDEACDAQHIIPSWHETLLSSRLKALAAGTDNVLPWEAAKRQLRELTAPQQVA
jgi:hypothetical protein